MPYKFVITVALSTAICAGPALAAAALAGDLNFNGYRNRPTPEAVRRPLLPRSRLGAQRGASVAPRLSSPGHGGWYQRGFGGSLNPGWGYNFEPRLGR
jgi:hypothetical protein